jgi:hypothetical protein
MGLVRIGKKWPRRTIFYQVSSKIREFDTAGIVQQAINEWQAATVLKFVNAPAPVRIDFVFSLESAARRRCNSPVGMQGGVQKIRCAPPFSLRTLVHEIGHAIGLHHEHQRPDRDNFVDLFPWPASPAVDFGKKHPPWVIPVGPYDCESVMHYRGNKFQSVRRCANPGRRDTPSDGDIAAVQFLYS